MSRPLLLLPVGALVFLVFALLSGGGAAGSCPNGALDGECLTPSPVPVSGPPPDEGPLHELPGDSNDEVAAAPRILTTPEVPSDEAATYHGYLPQIARDGFHPTATPTPTPTPTPEGPVIYLTFDDGPTGAWTPAILEVLARYGARATFFQLGTNVDAFPGISASIRAAGHTIGNHSYSHPNLTFLGWQAISDQIGWTQNALINATGDSTRCFRPPYGASNSTVANVAASYGLQMHLWTIDPRDWSRPGVWSIVNSVLGNARDGAIVLMHDGGGNRFQTVEALKQILPALSAQGYRFEALPC